MIIAQIINAEIDVIWIQPADRIVRQKIVDLKKAAASRNVSQAILQLYHDGGGGAIEQSPAAAKNGNLMSFDVDL